MITRLAASFFLVIFIVCVRGTREGQRRPSLLFNPHVCTRPQSLLLFATLDVSAN